MKNYSALEKVEGVGKRMSVIEEGGIMFGGTSFYPLAIAIHRFSD